jgi:predicted Zn-dependent protease
MDRRALLRLFAGGLGLATLTGCFKDLLGGKPKEPEIPAAHVEASRRVDELTHRILDQNTFTGIDPIVRTIGFPEAMLFHRGNGELYISQGLVAKCKTEEELAAVLCSELGKMMAQQRVAKATGRLPDTIPDIALPNGLPDANSVQLAELTLQERRRKQKILHELSEPVQLARKLLEGAGFNPNELDRVEAMVKQSESGERLRKQLTGSSPAPVWNR